MILGPEMFSDDIMITMNVLSSNLANIYDKIRVLFYKSLFKFALIEFIRN